MRALLATTAAAFAALGARAQTVTTVLNNGPTNARYDIVILAEGYQAFEQPLFNQNVQTFLTALFQKEPYATFAQYYNVHTVFRASAQSGADHPELTPPVYVNTAYDATYNVGGTVRCVYINNTSQALADAALAPANEGRVLVFVNDPTYGGCASQFAVSYNGPLMGEVQIHEMGHAQAGLADEYDYPYGTYTGGEPSQVNITTSPVGQKWSIWWGTSGVSSFQGAGYYLYGLYRPKNDCLMRNLSQPHCPICREAITLVTNSVGVVISSATPAAANVTVTVPTTQTFSFTHIVPPGNVPVISWLLDGVVIPGAVNANYTLNPSTVPIGLHTLTARIKDQSPFVRVDPANAMTETRSWQVSVVNPNASQLSVPALSTTSPWAQAGGSCTTSVTVNNAGPASSPATTVEYFLSTSGTAWSTQDMYLGSFPLPALAPSQSTTLQHVLAMPWRMNAQVYFVHAVVDRANVVIETNENDNSRSVPVFGQTPPCDTRLEWDDPLVAPGGAATISLSAGGAAHPTLVVPCVSVAQSLYLIAWGGSGTSPGITLSPSAHLPLNLDPLTNLGLEGLNGPIFASFLGIFDAQGRAHATFTLPPSTVLPTGATHFAAVVMTSTELFHAATNAIQLTLLP